MQSLRWGIIGCGLVAGDLILSLRQCQHDHRVVCTADADLSKAVGFLEEFGIKNGKAYSDYSELLQNPDVGGYCENSSNLFLDIVFIDLTNDAHVTWALKAIEAEKHIIVEKPLAVNKKQVRLIVEKARLSNKFLMEVIKQLVPYSNLFSRSGVVFFRRGERSKRSSTTKSWENFLSFIAILVLAAAR